MKKSLTPAQVRKILGDSAHAPASENTANQLGKGVINALEAVEKAAL